MSYFVKYADTNTVLPKKELLSAVFLIALDGSKILAIKNERGWEIPGGHIEQGETCEEALIREVTEEAGATFSDAKLLAIIESSNQDKYKDKVMLIYATKNFKLGEFIPSEDAFEREVIEIEEFLKRYKEGASNNVKHIMNFPEIIARAQKLISNS
jgi:ADP-ribose pyrophosphatase YjhB (NUDIX family)